MLVLNRVKCQAKPGRVGHSPVSMRICIIYIYIYIYIYITCSTVLTK